MSGNDKICQLCGAKPHNYACPRCNVLYCSTHCYRSEKHLDCSESFYKDFIQEEMKIASNGADQESYLKMMEILNRSHNLSSQRGFLDNDNENLLDSDDDEESLAERLKDVDLDDSKTVWNKLKEEEKQEFLSFAHTCCDNIKINDHGDLNNSKIVQNKLKEEQELLSFSHKSYGSSNIDNVTHNKINDAYWLPWWKSSMDNCPTVVNDVPMMNELTSKPPANCVKYNLVNVVTTIAIILRWSNGENINNQKEILQSLILTSENLKNNKNFEDVQSAVASCLSNSGFWSSFEVIKKDLVKLFGADLVIEPVYYLLCSLSYLHDLIETVLDHIKKKSLKKYPDLSKSKLQVLQKKVIYYLAYVSESSDEDICCGLISAIAALNEESSLETNSQ